MFTYADAVKSVKRFLTGNSQNRIVIFADSITRSKRVRDFNRKLENGCVQFQTIRLDKKKNNRTQEITKTDDKAVKVKSSVKLIGAFCRSAANQLNALIRLERFLGFEEKKVLINSYYYSTFNDCLLVWMFSHRKSLRKVDA